jgi:hypothetical protein
MRKLRWMIILPILLLASLACGLTSGLKQIQQAATQLPGMLTEAPTMLSPLETAAAEFTPESILTPSAGGQSLSLENIKTILQMTQMFEFTDDTVDGQPSAIAKLTDAGGTAFPALKDGFSAAFIGDPKDLNQIKITAPRSDSQATVDQGLGLVNIILSGVLPPDVQLSFITWLTENYAGVNVGGTLENTIGSMKFTLERTDTSETLTVTPIK